MRKIFLLFGLLVAVTMAVAQPPANYYNSANGLTGNQLKAALHNIIKGHTSVSYTPGIWNAFYYTDNKGNNKVWDMYSDVPGGTPPYVFTLGTNQCGNYKKEGDCYNREHTWAQNWFGNDDTAKTDLHHIFATDGFVNSKRSNYPFGEVGNVTWTSRNGSKLGTSITPGYTSTVFEPIDAYKGDIARALMYMSVRYYTEDATWNSSGMTTKSVINPWAIAMLLRWHEADPVSQKEIDRNNAIYTRYQHNRNPFVDHPEYAAMIWDPTWSAEEYAMPDNPPVDRIIVYDISGRRLLEINDVNEYNFILDLNNRLKRGCYIIQLIGGNRVIENKKLFVN